MASQMGKFHGVSLVLVFIGYPTRTQFLVQYGLNGGETKDVGWQDKISRVLIEKIVLLGYRSYHCMCD